MPKTLWEYADWLDQRGLIWPRVPPPEPVKATPYLESLRGIRAVLWNVYGTLLRISDGRLLHLHPEPLRMQVALEKTIEEFRMWPSMSRKPGAPWESLLPVYRRLVEDASLAGVGRSGDVPEVDSAVIWRQILGRLKQRDYRWDGSLYGDEHGLSTKMAYFFHANLQGVEARSDALSALETVAQSGLKQGLLADGQCFTVVQMLRALAQQGTLPPPKRLLDQECFVLSYREGLRKPSPSLYAACVRRLAQLGLQPREVLYVSHRVADDLAVARQFGLRTALLAAEKEGFQASAEDLADPDRRPDRLLTRLRQIRHLIATR